MRYLSFLILMLTLPATAGAETTSPPTALALVVGSNRPGPGQKPLRFAHVDAERFAGVIRELGGYRQNDVQILLDPSQGRLRDALTAMHRRLSALSATGRKPLFIFFYSGHARARSIELGPGEVPLAELRARLSALPARATVAVFDACQTGAISQIKDGNTRRQVPIAHGVLPSLRAGATAQM